MTPRFDDLPARPGPRPATTPANPHTQLEQLAPIELQNRLRDHALSLPGVQPGPSRVSVPGAVAFFLETPIEAPSLPDILGGEWGHIHPHHDGSLHINVPVETADRLIEAGWAEHHTLVASGILPPIVVMLYGPRDDAELVIAAAAVEEAYLAAGGARTDDTGQPLGFARD